MDLISRRALLKAGALTGVAALFSTPRGARGDSAGPAADGVEARGELTRSTFLAQVNTTFVAWRRGTRPTGLRLAHVGEVSAAAAAGTLGAEDCFSAVFTGVAYAPLRQGTYALWHPALGRLSLFLVPVGRSAKLGYYEAVINRRTA